MLTIWSGLQPRELNLANGTIPFMGSLVVVIAQKFIPWAAYAWRNLKKGKPYKFDLNFVNQNQKSLLIAEKSNHEFHVEKQNAWTRRNAWNTLLILQRTTIFQMKKRKERTIARYTSLTRKKEYCHDIYERTQKLNFGENRMALTILTKSLLLYKNI